MTEQRTVPGSFAGANRRSIDYTYDALDQVQTETREQGDPKLGNNHDLYLQCLWSVGVQQV